MVILWAALLFLHQGYSLVPVKTVHVGETATFTCDLSNEELSSRKVQWYKQRVGDTLKLIVSLYGTTKPSSEFLESRISAHNSKDFSNLTIWNVVQEDEGMYHCGVDTWIKLEWSGTYLLVKGNTERTSNYIVVQQPIESNPLRPGDTATLQCSVLTNSEKNTCSGHHNVLWFRDGSNKSLPNIIYTDGNKTDQCEKRSEPQDGCVYRLSKNVNSSDAGTYYCAVATCGEIFFGNGTKLDVQEKPTRLVFIEFVILITCFAISIIGNLFFICNRRVCKKCKEIKSDTTEVQTDNLYQPTEADDEINYAALSFSERKTRGRRTREYTEDTVFS
uniref:Uncharacterized LOC102079338 n=1 Tax=Oreochromis niloticus TaxID=8128 RepID=A0A669DX33_ORENI